MPQCAVLLSPSYSSLEPLLHPASALLTKNKEKRDKTIKSYSAQCRPLLNWRSLREPGVKGAKGLRQIRCDRQAATPSET
jgi:hypothetical protein